MGRIIRFILTTGCTWGSLGLHVLVCACFLRRWDKAAALTVYPFWVWCGAGLIMAALAWGIARQRLAGVVALVWLGTMLIFSDETRPLLRMAAEKPQPGRPAAVEGGAVPLRIITLNCRHGMWRPHVLDQLIPWQPDVVFLQEAPFPADLQKAAARLWPGQPGYFEGVSNCAILSRAKITGALHGHQPYSMLGTVELRPGKVVELACIHLAGAETGMKLWQRDTWRSHYYNRQSRRIALAAVLGAQQVFIGDHPVIVGGDFNAPAGDGVFDALERRGFIDAAKAAGIGWPCTYPNAAPVLRIDQLWMRGLQPVRARTVESEHTDHRMVICDFLIP
jgi:endonuclease/exonuclease/phosphatase (EEP) superfamily protein YafD